MTETIKDFLVSLGWEYDKNQAKGFVDAINHATLRAKLLGDALEEMARKTWEAVAGVAEAFDQLYFSSQRTLATASTIRDFGYAVKQLGGSAESAQASLEAMGQKLRENPGNIAYLNKLGFGINKVTGHLEVQADLLAKFQRMPMAVAEQYRALAGEDEGTFLAMRNGTFQKEIDEAKAFRKRLGFDPDQATKDANEFMTTWRRVAMELGNIADDLLTKLQAALTGPFQEFEKFIDANGPEIGQAIQEVTNAIHDMTDAWVKDFEAIIKEPHAFDNFRAGMHDLEQDVVSLAEHFHAFIKDLQWLNNVLNSGANVLNRLLGLPDAQGAFDGVGGGPVNDGSPSTSPNEIGVDQLPNGVPAAGGASPRSSGLGDAARRGWNWLKGKFGYGDSASAPIAPPKAGGAAQIASPTSPSTAPSGDSPTPGTATPASVVTRLMHDYGLTREQAIGAAGVMGYESGNFSVMQERPSAYNDWGRKPGGWGWAQWTGPRRRAFMEWARAHHLNPASDAANYGFLQHELATDYRHVIPIMKRQRTVADAAYAWERHYEGMDGTAGVPAFRKHIGRAQEYDRTLPKDIGVARNSGASVGDSNWPSWGGIGTTAIPQAASPWGALDPHAFDRPPGVARNAGATTHVNAPVNSTFNITTSDPQTAAAMVAANQKRITDDMTRNMVGATN